MAAPAVPLQCHAARQMMRAAQPTAKQDHSPRPRIHVTTSLLPASSRRHPLARRGGPILHPARAAHGGDAGRLADVGEVRLGDGADAEVRDVRARIFASAVAGDSFWTFFPPGTLLFEAGSCCVRPPDAFGIRTRPIEKIARLRAHDRRTFVGLALFNEGNCNVRAVPQRFRSWALSARLSLFRES